MFVPGSSIPKYSHKDHSEVSLIVEGRLTNTVKWQPQMLPAATPVLNGREVEPFPASNGDKPVGVLGADLIKHQSGA
jgi:hypothetical protein